MRRVALLVLIFLAAASLITTASASQPHARSAALTRLVPPPDGQANFGFTFRLFDSTDPIWGDTRPFAERMRDSIDHELAGKTPTFLTVWAPWQWPDQKGKPYVPFSYAAPDVARVLEVVGDQGVIRLDWNLTQSNGANEGLSVREIREGQADAYIRSYARDVRDYGKPILMTLFNGEFNGDWWWAVSPQVNRRLTTRDFVQAWQRVVDIFRAVGASNVAWAWVVNGYPADPKQQPQIDRNINAYYPGDAYVDWVGVDVYDVGTPSWMDGPYALAVAHAKPVLVGEFGIRHEWSSTPPSQWQPWLTSIFDYFQSHPAIKAISYFNYCNRAGASHVKWDSSRSIYLDDGRVNYVPNLNDHDHRLLAGGPGVQALFANRISSPRYVSAVATERVESKPVVATATLLTLKTRHSIAVARWDGNLAAHTYDLQTKRRAGTWRNVASGVSVKSKRIEGSPGEPVQLRVRAHDVDGVAGPWSAPRRLIFSK